MKRYYDKKRKQDKDGNAIYSDFQEGDRVWLDGRNLRTLRPSKKLDAKRLGPFKILKKIGSSAYRLQLPASWTRVHPVFNEILLTPYYEPMYPSQKPPEPPGPIDVEGHPEYEVEEILQERRRGRGIQYLVKWKGYGHEENTWEPKSSLINAQEALKEFSRRKLRLEGDIVRNRATEIAEEAESSETKIKTMWKPHGHPVTCEEVEDPDSGYGSDGSSDETSDLSGSIITYIGPEIAPTL
jgi:hypothetical protein